MLVIGQRFGELHLKHVIHGDAVCQAVALIESRAEKPEAGIKRFTGLRFDVNPAVDLHLRNHPGRGLTYRSRIYYPDVLVSSMLGWRGQTKCLMSGCHIKRL